MQRSPWASGSPERKAEKAGIAEAKEAGRGPIFGFALFLKVFFTQRRNGRNEKGGAEFS
jgi:hypothetical protein